MSSAKKAKKKKNSQSNTIHVYLQYASISALAKRHNDFSKKIQIVSSFFLQFYFGFLKKFQIVFFLQFYFSELRLFFQWLLWQCTLPGRSGRPIRRRLFNGIGRCSWAKIVRPLEFVRQRWYSIVLHVLTVYKSEVTDNYSQSTIVTMNNFIIHSIIVIIMS